MHRFYRGGHLIGELRGHPEPDGSTPEDWVGSVTPALNPGRDDPLEGLAELADGRLVRDAVEADPVYWLGEEHVSRFGSSPGLLVKLLDAGERLPVHAHPNRDFARAHLGSQFGKTEAWVVLGTRGRDAELWIGLREPVDRDDFRRWIEHQETERLLRSLNTVRVSGGDVVYVPAGVPHAIGSGVLIAELQEPTDFSVICEWQGFPIAADDTHLGLGWGLAFDALDLGPHEPVLGLPEEAATFFWVDDRAEPAGRFAVLLVLDGVGSVDGHRANPGSAFVVPAAAAELRLTGDLRVLRCLAPVTDFER